MTTVTRPTTGLMPRGFSRLLELRRTRGSARAWYALLRKAASHPVLRRCVHICAGDVFMLPLTASKSAAKTPKTYVVRQAVAEDVPAVADYYGDRQRVEERFERGDVCALTLCQEKIGAAVWLVVGPGEFNEDWEELHYVCHVPAGFAWTYDGRGTKLGAWGTMMARFPKLMQELGVTELATLIDCNNWKSIDAHVSLGYQHVGVVGCAGLFGIKRSLFKPSEKRWQLLPTSIHGLEITGSRGKGQDRTSTKKRSPLSH